MEHFTTLSNRTRYKDPETEKILKCINPNKSNGALKFVLFTKVAVNSGGRTVAPGRIWGRHFHTFAVFLSTLTLMRHHCLLECGKRLFLQVEIIKITTAKEVWIPGFN